MLQRLTNVSTHPNRTSARLIDGGVQEQLELRHGRISRVVRYSFRGWVCTKALNCHCWVLQVSTPHVFKSLKRTAQSRASGLRIFFANSCLGRQKGARRSSAHLSWRAIASFSSAAMIVSSKTTAPASTVLHQFVVNSAETSQPFSRMSNRARCSM